MAARAANPPDGYREWTGAHGARARCRPEGRTAPNGGGATDLEAAVTETLASRRRAEAGYDQPLARRQWPREARQECGPARCHSGVADDARGDVKQYGSILRACLLRGAVTRLGAWIHLLRQGICRELAACTSRSRAYRCVASRASQNRPHRSSFGTGGTSTSTKARRPDHQPTSSRIQMGGTCLLETACALCQAARSSQRAQSAAGRWSTRCCSFTRRIRAQGRRFRTRGTSWPGACGTSSDRDDRTQNGIEVASSQEPTVT